MEKEEIDNNNHSSSSMAASSVQKKRFLGYLSQPDPNSTSNSFELDESDVIWSSDLSDSPTEPISPALSSTSLSSNSSSTLVSGGNHHFRPEKFGLSAALSDDQRFHIQRKPSLDAANAARTIPPVAISISRSGSNSEDFLSNPSSGKFHQSAPVNVPIWPRNGSSNNNKSRNLGFFYEDVEIEEEEEETEEQMLPPHEIVARSHVSTFSVFEGVGRTLKGRDLHRVRNAVWQKTVRGDVFTYIQLPPKAWVMEEGTDEKVCSATYGKILGFLKKANSGCSYESICHSAPDM